jgi:hypothetical protein
MGPPPDSGTPRGPAQRSPPIDGHPLRPRPKQPQSLWSHLGLPVRDPFENTQQRRKHPLQPQTSSQQTSPPRRPQWRPGCPLFPRFLSPSPERAFISPPRYHRRSLELRSFSVPSPHRSFILLSTAQSPPSRLPRLSLSFSFSPAHGPTRPFASYALSPRLPLRPLLYRL